MRETSIDRRRARVGAVVLLRADGAALLQHRDDKPGLAHAGLWVFPGGHCEPNESIEDCARREFFEETGYVCDRLNPLTSIDGLAVDGFPAIDLIVFWIGYDGAQVARCFEGQALAFVDRFAAERYAMPDYLLPLWDMALAARARS